MQRETRRIYAILEDKQASFGWITEKGYVYNHNYMNLTLSFKEFQGTIKYVHTKVREKYN